MYCQLEHALRTLSSHLANLATDAEHQLAERCGYRDRFDRCTFGAACRNRVKRAGVPHCSGDGDLA